MSRRAMTNPALRGLLAGQHRGIAGSAWLGLKESSSQDPQSNYDKHKQDSLSKQKDGKGHWKSELASDSEEAVKADRSTKPESMKTMQERTKRAAEEKNKAGTSMHDGL